MFNVSLTATINGVLVKLDGSNAAEVLTQFNLLRETLGRKEKAGQNV